MCLVWINTEAPISNDNTGFSLSERFCCKKYFVVHIMPRSCSLKSCCIHAEIIIFLGITWETRSAIALSVACAVAYIHSTNNATSSHSNINSSNILLTESYEACVSEHGLKTLVSSPTSITNNDSAQKDDVYSFGIVLLEMLTGMLSIKKFNSQEPYLIDWILSVPNDEHWAAQVFDKKLLTNSSFVVEMVQFAKIAIHCCEKNPTLRPAMSEVAQPIEEIRGSKAGDR